MANETEYLTVLKYNYISQQFTKYAGVLLYIICLFGTTMNILTFMQQVYNSRTCSCYLLSAAICDFIHLNFGSLSNILQYGFHYDWTINSITYCKIKSYAAYVFTVMSATFTILASIDRYILSSRKSKRWKFSSRSIAKRCIAFTILFWFIVSVPIVFCSTRINHSSGNEQLICSNHSRLMSCFLMQILYICVFNGFVPPFALMYFGFLTYYNARGLHQRCLSNSSRIRQINYQLTLMLILQSIKSSFASIPFFIFNCYLLITMNLQKSPLYQAKENLINQIVYLLFWSNYTSFVVYFHSSGIFRYQCLTALRKLACGICNNEQKHSNEQTELKHLTTTTKTLDEKYKRSKTF